jgi:hypothetical protein
MLVEISVYLFDTTSKATLRRDHGAERRSENESEMRRVER